MKKAGTKPTIKILPISALRTDGKTHGRVGLTSSTVDYYADEMKDGVKFPPVDVFYDGESYWLADGFHRLAAAEAANFSEICCRVRQGSREDAQLFCYGANKDNGAQRSAKDTIRAVQGALAHPFSIGMSNKAVGKHVGVSERSIAEYRARLAAAGSKPAGQTGANSGQA